MELFFQSGPGCELYELYRDNPDFIDSKESVEKMWQEFKQFANTNFRSDAKNNFEQRLFEMQLALSLKQDGYKLIKTKDSDLDLRILLEEEHHLSIEVTFPMKGEGPNAAPDRPHGYSGSIKNFINPLIPRVTQRLDEKVKQIEKKNLKEPIIVAINSANIDDLSNFNLSLDLIETVCFGRGDIQIDANSNPSYTSRQTPITKANGSEISIALFENDEYKMVSAVLYRYRHPAVTSAEIVDDVMVIHNPNANYPLDPEKFTIGLHRIWENKKRLVTIDYRPKI